MSSSRTDSPSGNRTVSSWTASSRRAAALPVGAASAMSGGREPRATACRDQLRGDPSHPGRLPRAGPAGDHLQPPARGELVQVGGDRALLAPVAVEVQPRPEQSQRRADPMSSSPTATNSLGPTRGQPLIDLGPRQRGQVDGLVGFDGRRVADRRQVDEHVAEAWTAHGERDASRTASSSSPTSSARRTATCTSAADSSPMSLKRAEQPGGAHAARRHLERIRDRAHAASPSSTSLSAMTRPPGGRHGEHAGPRTRPPSRARTGRARRPGGGPAS